MTVAAASALTPGRRVAGRHAAIVGGSLGGLAAAHALEKTGWSVDVYERSPTELRNKGSGLGFVHVPSWERLTQRPMMRRQQRASRAQGSFYYGDLWGYLYDGLAQNENVKVHLGKTITELQGTVEAPIINKTPYDLVVLVDGGFSALRHHVLGADIKPEYAGYVVWRGGVPASKLSPELQSNLRYLEGVYKSDVLKMAKDNGDDLWTFGTFVATPESDVEKYWNKDKDGQSRHGSSQKNSVVPDWFLSHMKQHFSNVPHLVPLMEQIVQKGELTPHPQYEFGNIDQVHKGRVLLLGDAAHMASPRTAVGAHTAILDALALQEAMAPLLQTSAEAFNDKKKNAQLIDRALRWYSRDGVSHAQQLYARTREVSQEFVPEGKILSPEAIYAEEQQASY